MLDHLGLGALGFVEVLAHVTGEMDEFARAEAPAEFDLAGAGGRDLLLDGLLRADRAAGDDGRLDQVAGIFDVALDVGQFEPLFEELHLEAELPEDVLAAFLGGALELDVGLAGRGLLACVGLVEVFLPGLVELGLELGALLRGLGEHLVIRVAGLDLLVDDHLVEALFLAEDLEGEVELVGQGEPAGEEVVLGLQFGVLDALGDLDFLFAGEQRLVAHLLQVDIERIVRGVGRDGAGGFFFGVLDLLAVRLDLIFVQELDVQVVEDVHDVLDQLRVGGAVGDDLIDVLDGHEAVLLGKTDEQLDLLVDGGADARRDRLVLRRDHEGQLRGDDLGDRRLRRRGFDGRGLVMGRGGLDRGSLRGSGLSRGGLRGDRLHGRLGRGLGGGFDDGLGLLGGFGRLVGGLFVLLIGHLGKIRRR